MLEPIRISNPSIFRWFKFTLKPPYTVAHGNLSSTIWGTSHWTSFVKFGLKTAWDISYDILWPILKYVNFWWLQGRSSNLSKKDAFRKSIFSRWRSDEASTRLGGFRWAGPKAIWWYHFWGVWHTWATGGASGRAFSTKVPFSWHICGSLEGTGHWLIWSRISPQVWTRVLYIPWVGFLNASPIGCLLGL